MCLAAASPPLTGLLARAPCRSLGFKETGSCSRTASLSRDFQVGLTLILTLTLTLTITLTLTLTLTLTSRV